MNKFLVVLTDLHEPLKIPVYRVILHCLEIDYHHQWIIPLEGLDGRHHTNLASFIYLDRSVSMIGCLERTWLLSKHPRLCM